MAEKKKNTRRMKKQVRKTLGALFLASAVAVAAIPTGSIEGGNANASVVLSPDGTMRYNHVVNSPYFAGDSSAHSENYIDPSTQTAKSVFVNSAKLDSSKIPAGAIGETTSIPLCNVENTTIYSTSDGFFRFAYVDSAGEQNGEGTKSAVILAYTNEGSLENGTLEIPAEVDAYLNLNDNSGMYAGLTAVGKSGNYLFYVTDSETEFYTQQKGMVDAPRKDPVTGEELYWVSYDGILYDETLQGYTMAQVQQLKAADEAKAKEEGRVSVFMWKNATDKVEGIVYTYYAPCTNVTYNTWKNKELYYYPTDDFKASGNVTDNKYLDDAEGQKHVIPQLANTQTYERIANAPVYYIGNQYLDTSRTKIEGIITTPEKGVFANKGNIGTLIISSNLIGIGDYAFYGCSVASAKFDNGLNTIGNHAFDNCTRLSSVTIPSESNITTIGAYAFKNCRSLLSFAVPSTVKSIGDGVFKNCWSLESIDLGAMGTRLENLGSYVFMNCTALKHLSFPRGFSETIELSEFEGCNSLEYIRSENSVFNIVASTTCDYNWEAFKNEFNGGDEADIVKREKFFVEAPNQSPLHTICTQNEISYKYLDEDIYELTKAENGIGDPTVTYRVNSNNNLLSCTFNGDAESLEFPEYVGPYSIATINDDAFRDNCSLKTIRISSTIRTIGARAFQGCHNLEYVFFDNDTVAIGDYAFQTQEVSVHKSSSCSRDITDSSTNKPRKTLHFVGTVGSDCTAYNYAMSYNGRYSTGSQSLSFIEYNSGWPTCITLQYNYNTTTQTGYSELVDFPSQSDLADYAHKEYLTADEQQAAQNAIINQNAGTLTSEQEKFINAARSLTIPKGVDAIKDGLFRQKTENISQQPIPVYCYGLKKIEAAYTSEPDDDGYPKVDPEKSDFAGCTNLSEIYFYGDTESIADKAFSGDTRLARVNINGTTKGIGDHAFEGCSILSDVSVSGDVESIGIRPFSGCKILSHVDFQTSENFVCENSIIYGLDNGEHAKIIQILESRSSRVNATNDDLSNVTSMEKEAFEGSSVSTIDLSSSKIGLISERAFANTPNLTYVELPATRNVSNVRINTQAFKGSAVKEISGEQNVNTIDPGATDGIIANAAGGLTDNVDTSNNRYVTIYAPEDSALQRYADAYNFNYSAIVPTVYFTVNFRDWNEELGQNVDVKEEIVERGGAANPPEPNGKEGKIFDMWEASNNISTLSEINSDTIFTAIYREPEEGYGKHLVTYIDYTDEVYATEYVEDGGDAKMSFKEPTRPGYTFSGWRGSLTNITSDVMVYAEYEEGYRVRYYYYDDEGEKQLFYSQMVKEGESGPMLGAPVEKAGFSFTGWLPVPKDIQEPTDTYAQYVADGTTGVYTVTYYDNNGEVFDTMQVLSGGNAPNISGPVREGYTFVKWLPSLTNVTSNREVFPSYSENPRPSIDPGTGIQTPTPDPGGTTPTTPPGSLDTPAPAPAPTYYVLTVRNGSGSGSYVAGSQPIIVANDPASNQEFSNWSIEPSDTVIASKALSATVITMPAENVTVTANYRAKSGSSNNSGSGTTGSSNSSRVPTSSATIKNGNTTVVIDKNGLSNTGVVSATVNGSSDNFTIKVSESSAASEAAIKALMAEYSDISSIKYFPMDISLYDSTGQKKITDTTGLSITITLPLPDSLSQYAGNNKIASVSNGKLEKLTAKFTTISRVPCITFTAEHFSPYVIYVDTNNLNASAMVDSTPKTGDGIHPKWFLSAGLACISVVLFMKKDKKPAKRRLAKA